MASKTNLSQTALGMIETRGMLAAIEAADAMVKTANVTVISQSKAGGGIITTLVRGEVGSVKAATDAGATAANKVGELMGVHIIPRPDLKTEALLDNLLDQAD